MTQLGVTGSTNVHLQRTQLLRRFNEAADWFLREVPQRTINARLRRAGDEQLASAADAVREIAAALEASRQQQRELEARLESMASVAEAAREAAGESVGEDLSEFYTGRAQAHERGWQRWRIALVVAIGCAVAGSLAVVLVKRPEGDITDAEVISRLLVDLLIVGLLLYVVRVAAHQFSVHRHLEEVSTSKAAALLTFSRVRGQPARTRNPRSGRTDTRTSCVPTRGYRLHRQREQSNRLSSKPRKYGVFSFQRRYGQAVGEGQQTPPGAGFAQIRPTLSLVAESANGAIETPPALDTLELMLAAILECQAPASDQILDRLGDKYL